MARAVIAVCSQREVHARAPHCMALAFVKARPILGSSASYSSRKVERSSRDPYGLTQCPQAPAPALPPAPAPGVRRASTQSSNSGQQPQRKLTSYRIGYRGRGGLQSNRRGRKVRHERGGSWWVKWDDVPHRACARRRRHMRQVQSRWLQGAAGRRARCAMLPAVDRWQRRLTALTARCQRRRRSAAPRALRAAWALA